MEHPNQCRGKLNTNICNTDLNCFPVGENGPHVEKGEAETQYRHALQFRAKTGRVCGRGSLRGCCSNIARGGRCLESLDIFVKSGLNPSEVGLGDAWRCGVELEAEKRHFLVRDHGEPQLVED